MVCVCVCDNVVCERWCATKKMVYMTKLCVKDRLCESCAWKKAVVCERWCVTKRWAKDDVAKDGVWQSCVPKMVWWKMVCTKHCIGVYWHVSHANVTSLQCHQKSEHNNRKMKHRTFQHYAAPATPNARRCLQVPRLPREGKVDVPKCHACQVKGRRMLPSATPATQSAAASPATTGDQGACHAKRMSMSPSATPATWNEGGWRQVPHLPRKVPRRHRRPTATKRATKCNLCRACHAKRRSMSPSATTATWKDGGCRLVPRLPPERKVDATMFVQDGVWQSCVWKRVRDKVVCVWQSCLWKMVCDKVVCETWCIKLCVKDGGWQSCVWKMVSKFCV